MSTTAASESHDALMAISPLDGRYRTQAAELRDYYSEFALIRYRYLVEVEWLVFVLSRLKLAGAPPIDEARIETLRGWASAFGPADAAGVKAIERTTRHDVKAVEYVLRDKLAAAGLNKFIPFVHLCCTSEDINNLSHALMLRDGLNKVWLPALEECIAAIGRLASAGVATPMLSRTHGQAASPTTIGKEMAVFVARLDRQLEQFRRQPFLAKFNGAVGNFNAHAAAYPEVDWPAASREFISGFGLELSPLTTQIEPHDYMAETFQLITRVNSIILDFDRDVWSYVSLGYLKQKLYAGEVGSSTMPHKINPIDFENSEANAGIAIALLGHLATKLPVSRMQRDLSDSSTMRSLGVGIGHSLLALRSCMAGLKKVDINAAALAADLDANWAVLAEAIQTVLRKHGVEDAYERLKALTQDRAMDAEVIRAFIAGCDIPEPDKGRLMALTPAGFVGLASALATEALAKR
jgi:adenylosuccinate lyase